MDWNKIENLLKRYYDGETSLAEEQEIRNAFQGGDVPAHLQAEAKLMTYLSKASTEESAAAFSQPSSGGAVLSLKPKKNISLYIRQFIAAASVILVIGFGIKFWGPTSATSDCSNQILATINNQEICDKELAKEEARKALILISSKLNKGTNDLGHLKTINKPSEITQKSKN